MRIEVLEMSLFDIPRPISHDVVLALNIFHHYLKTKALFERLRWFLRGLSGVQMVFLETHLSDDPVMEGAYAHLSPQEFAECVRDHTDLRSVRKLGETSRGRSLFVIEQ